MPIEPGTCGRAQPLSVAAAQMLRPMDADEHSWQTHEDVSFPTQLFAVRRFAHLLRRRLHQRFSR